MKQNKPKRPLLTAGLVVSIVALILSWTEAGLPLAALAIVLIAVEVVRSRKFDLGSGKLIASVVMIIITLFVAIPPLMQKEKTEPEVIGLKVHEACQKIKEAEWKKVTVDGRFGGYSLRSGSCSDEHIVKSVNYRKALDEVSLEFEIDDRSKLTESELARYHELTSHKESSGEAPAHNQPSHETPSSNAGSVSPALKKSLDEYEAYMNKYVDMMKRYKANPSDVGILSEYTESLKKYAEFTESIKKVDQASLSSADSIYYLEVTTRVAKKIAEVQ